MDHKPPFSVGSSMFNHHFLMVTSSSPVIFGDAMNSSGERAPPGLRGGDGAGPPCARPRGAAADAATRTAGAAARRRDEGGNGPWD